MSSSSKSRSKKATGKTPAKSEPGPSTSTDKGTAVTTPNSKSMNLEYDFLCGMCQEYLTNPRMCPACRYKSCESCFKEWHQQRTKLNMVPTCPQCDAALNLELLVHIPSLDELDRKFTSLQKSVESIESTLTDLLHDFSQKFRDLEANTDAKLFQNKLHSAENLNLKMTEVKNQISGLIVTQNILRNDIETTKQKVQQTKPMVSALPGPWQVVRAPVLPLQIPGLQPLKRKLTDEESSGSEKSFKQAAAYNQGTQCTL